MAARKNHCETPPSYLYLGGGDQSLNPISTSDHAHFEFDEAELWSSSWNDVMVPSEPKRLIRNSRAMKKPTKRSDTIDRRPIKTSSLPVNIPDWSKILRNEYNNRRGESGRDDIDNDEDDNENEDDRIPPHEYLARTRIASFSVHEGIGRTLKGRDLSRVRNAIWKQTGFED